MNAGDSPTTLGVLGFGRWGKVLVDSVQGKSETVRFVAAAARDPDRVAAEAGRRELRVAPDLATLLADDSVGGIVLATPHSLHGEQIEACIKAGKPVLVEKPFTLTRASAASVLDLAREYNVLVAAAHNRRFLAPVVTLKQMMSGGALGIVLHIETHFSSNVVGRYPTNSWRVAEGESPAGGLAGSGIHQIDALIHLDSLITEVFAWTSRRVPELPIDDKTAAMFKLASGATASLITITATAATYRIEVFGSKAKAELTGDAGVRGSETLEVTYVDGSRERFDFPPLDIERAELEAFGAAIRGEARYPVAPEEVLNGIAAFEAVSDSASSGLPVVLR
jgi:predicted dehydrogenase